MGLITKSSPINFGSVNRMMPQIMSMLSQKHFIDLRNRNMQDYLEKQMSGYRGLEKQRHGSRLIEQEDRHDKELDYLYKSVTAGLADDSRAEQLRGEIFLKKQQGVDATREINELEKVSEIIAKGLVAGSKLETLSLEDTTNLARVSTEDFLKSYSGQIQTSQRQQERMTREVEPDIALGKRRVGLLEREEERELEAGGEVGGLDYNKLSKMKDGLVKEKAMILNAMGDLEYTAAPEITERLNADLARVEGEIKTVFDEMKKQSGVFGGAPTESAFSIYRQRLIANGVPEAEADRMAREKYPE